MPGDALLLDLDGTLAPIEDRPDMVAIPQRTLAALATLSVRLGGRIAVVSGRSLDEVRRLTAGAIPMLAGIHGLERQMGARHVRVQAAPGIAPVGAALRAFAASRPGVLVEDKGLSVALHFRLAPDHGAEALALARTLAAAHKLTVQTGKMVVELRTPGADKGAALAAFMAEPPFVGSRPWFAGDDDTDEAGFIAAEAHGGTGIFIGDARPTAARYRLPDIAALAAWLEAGAAAA